MKLRIEKWTSEGDKREIHFYLGKSQSDYVFGYSPKFVSKKKLKKILKILKGK